MQKLMKEYALRHLSVAHDKLLLAVETGTYDAFHDFRVAIKRIISLEKMIRRQVPTTRKYLKALKSLKGVYRAAGKARDLQVSRLLVDTYANKQVMDLAGLCRFIDISLEIRLDGFKKVCRGLPAALFDNLIPRFERIVESDPADFAEAWVRHVQKLLRRLTRQKVINDMERLHAYRKLIKQLRFLREAALPGLENGALVDVFSGFGENRIKTLEELIGTQNDHFMLRKLIKRYVNRNEVKNNKDAHICHILMEVINSEMEEGFKKFNLELKTITPEASS